MAEPRHLLHDLLKDSSQLYDSIPLKIIDSSYGHALGES